METVIIQVFDKNDKKYIKFTFNGRLKTQDSKNTIIKWYEIFAQFSDKKYIVICDCKCMQSYDHQARVKWQSALNEMSSQIDFIWIITQSRIFKMGAQVIIL